MAQFHLRDLPGTLLSNRSVPFADHLASFFLSLISTQRRRDGNVRSAMEISYSRFGFIQFRGRPHLVIHIFSHCQHTYF